MPGIAADAILLRDIDQAIQKRSECKLDSYYPDTGPLRRELYPKHVEFFRAGATHRERAFIAANRCGKSEAGAYEATLHMTGLYPPWWEGRRFTDPTRGWAVGETNKVVRDSLQEKLLGGPGEWGTGMIPRALLHKATTKQGTAETVDTIYVQHVSGGLSSATLKSYQEGREAFQGSAVHWAWMDEEAPLDIYSEVLMRTMTTDGLVWLTFTPLLGLSPLVLEFLPSGNFDEK